MMILVRTRGYLGPETAVGGRQEVFLVGFCALRGTERGATQRYSRRLLICQHWRKYADKKSLQNQPLNRDKRVGSTTTLYCIVVHLVDRLAVVAREEVLRIAEEPYSHERGWEVSDA